MTALCRNTEVSDADFALIEKIFSASGMTPFVPEQWDETLGGWIELPGIEEET